MTTLPAPAFSYQLLDQKLAGKLYAEARAIKVEMGKGALAIIVAGERLAGVRDMLPHGQWGPWLATEFNWSESTARRYIAVAERFSGANRSRVAGFSAQALYLLASDETPEAAVVEVLERQDAGEELTTEAVKEVVRKARKPREQPTEPAAPPQAEGALPFDLPMLHQKLAGVAGLAGELDAMRKNALSLQRLYSRDDQLRLAAAGMPGLREQLDDLATYVARQLWPEGSCPECHGDRATAKGECQACRGGGWATAQQLHGGGRR